MLSFFHAFGRVLPFALVLAVVPAAAQDYPSRPVTIVVGYTPGATSDLVARTIGTTARASEAISRRHMWPARSPTAIR